MRDAENPMVLPLSIGESDAFGRKKELCFGCGRVIYEDEPREYFSLDGVEHPYCEYCVDDCADIGAPI